MFVMIEYVGRQLMFTARDISDSENHIYESLIDNMIEQDYYYLDDSNNLILLNNCVDILTQFVLDVECEIELISYTHPEEADPSPRIRKRVAQCKSLLTFIDEAASHKEYCNLPMLQSFASSLEDVLQGWRDDTYYDPNLIIESTMGKSVSVEDIRKIYKSICLDDTAKGFYNCDASAQKKTNNLYRTSLAIQIAYTILIHLFKFDSIIKRCENCGKLFIPTRASDKYCSRTTDRKTCSEIKKLENQMKSHSKELNKLYKRIDNRLYQREEFDTQDAFRSGFKQCKDEDARRQYLNEWDASTYLRKPERQDEENGEHEKK